MPTARPIARARGRRACAASVPRGGPRRSRTPRRSVHATGSAAAVVRAAFVAWAATCCGASGTSRRPSRAAAEGARSRAAHGSGRNVVRDHEVTDFSITSDSHRFVSALSTPLARRLRGGGSASRRRRDNSIEHDEGAATVAGHALGGARTHFSSASIPLSPDSRAICGRFVFAVESCADSISQTTRRCAR